MARPLTSPSQVALMAYGARVFTLEAVSDAKAEHSIFVASTHSIYQFTIAG